MTIEIPIEVLRNIAEMRNAQKKGKTFQARELEKIVDRDLAAITNAGEHVQTKVDRFYDDIDLEVESRR